MAGIQKNYNTDILIVGSGPGATAFLNELLKKKRYSVIVAEKGKKNVNWGKSTEQRCRNIYRENGSFPKSIEGVIYYRHNGLGGTLEISCANGVKASKTDIAKIGIDIEDEMAEVEKELGITPLPDSHVGDNAAIMISAAQDLGFQMNPMPKFIDFDKCTACAKCESLCPNGAKWSSKKLLASHEAEGRFMLLDGLKIEEIVIEKGVARYALGTTDNGPVKIEARAFVLAGGALGSSVILQKSGIKAGSNFFLDLYTVVYGKNKKFQNERDLPMPAFYHHPDDAFLISPYLDPELWIALRHRKMSGWLNGENIDGLMIKMKDEPSGSVNPDGTINKSVTEKDKKTMKTGIDIAREILIKSGTREENIIVTSPRGAHPGGVAAVGKVVDENLKVMNVDNMYVSDSSVFPESLGKPPIVAIMALSKKLAKSFQLAQ
ncbi:MAG: GMC oxidoreductase [Thermodesulfobacteriota bacterium]|nr:GMC oxidoreductase [Thermodesulfobacteriota bacterium]